MSRLASIALMLSMLGCGRSMTWEYSMPTSLDGSSMTARVRAGSCEGTEVLFERAFVDGEPSGAGPVLPAGTYGIEIEAYGSACEVIARGCREVSLPGGEVTHVMVVEIPPEPSCAAPLVCAEGTCMVDPTRDAGMADAGTPESDTGVDTGASDVDGGVPNLDECTVDTDCPCGGDSCTGGSCIPVRPVTTVEAGATHACAISRGQLFCWGHSNIGAVGAVTETPTPMRVGGASDWTDLSSLGSSNCGIQGGRVQCWGSNFARQCGVDVGDFPNVLGGPMSVSPATSATRVAVGTFHGFALNDGGVLTAFGQNDHAQSGGSANPEVPLPLTVLSGTWRDISAGEFFSCGVSDAGALSCWGANFSGSFGIPSGMGCTDCGPRTVDVPEGVDWARVELGRRHACGWDTSGDLYCWGRGDGESEGALGVGAPPPPSIRPTAIVGHTVTAASLWNHTCVIDTEGTLWCFGPNESGQLGLGDQDTRFVPTAVSGSGWADVTTGSNFTCATRVTGALHCWGHVLGMTTAMPPVPDVLSPTRLCMP